MPKPLILVTNDDGIYSPGIYFLQQEVAKIGRTIVFAPESEKSAVGHAITISDPIRIRELSRRNGFSGYAVGGTPADCVKLGVKAILDIPPDIIVSGVNLGSNMGMNILYSGTVSAATEGVILGIPSIAISVDSHKEPDYTVAAKICAKFVKIVLENGIPKGTALNINVPNVKEDEIKGVRLTKQGHSYYEEDFDRRVDPRERIYYWMDGRLIPSENDLELDDIAVQENWISVTPLHYNLTDLQSFNELRNWEIFINEE